MQPMLECKIAPFHLRQGWVWAKRSRLNMVGETVARNRRVSAWPAIRVKAGIEATGFDEVRHSPFAICETRLPNVCVASGQASYSCAMPQSLMIDV